MWGNAWAFKEEWDAGCWEYLGGREWLNRAWEGTWCDVNWMQDTAQAPGPNDRPHFTAPAPALLGFDERLARVLLRLCDGQGFVAFTHVALAAETASGRALVSRRLAALARAGLVAQRKGGVQILDHAALERIAAVDR